MFWYQVDIDIGIDRSYALKVDYYKNKSHTQSNITITLLILLIFNELCLVRLDIWQAAVIGPETREAVDGFQRLPR